MSRVNVEQVEDLILGCWFDRNEAMDVAVCEQLQMQEPVSAATEFIIYAKIKQVLLWD